MTTMKRHGPGGWYATGQAASALLKETPHGERERVVRGIAAARSTYDNEVRRTISAYEFVAGIADASLAGELRRRPLTLVDLVAAWAAHDPRRALVEARTLVGGGHTYQTLRDAERAARPRDVASARSRAAEHADAIAAFLCRKGARERIAAPGGMEQAPVDLWLRDGRGITAVLAPGPYPQTRDYCQTQK